jgi:hypothetical protein
MCILMNIWKFYPSTAQYMFILGLLERCSLGDSNASRIIKIRPDLTEKKTKKNLKTSKISFKFVASSCTKLLRQGRVLKRKMSTFQRKKNRKDPSSFEPYMADILLYIFVSYFFYFLSLISQPFSVI